MRAFSISLTTFLAVVVSCVLWIGGISWILVELFGVATATGWSVAGILGALAISAIAVLIHEVRHAIDLPDNVDLEMLDGYVEEPFSEVHRISTRFTAKSVVSVYSRR